MTTLQIIGIVLLVFGVLFIGLLVYLFNCKLTPKQQEQFECDKKRSWGRCGIGHCLILSPYE